MGHQLSPKNREVKKKPERVSAKHSPSPEPTALVKPEVLQPSELMNPAMVQRMNQSIGNQAVQRLLMKKGLMTAQSGLAQSILQREGDETEDGENAVESDVQSDDESEGDVEAKEPAVKTPAKPMIDKAKAIQVLQDSYKDYVKKIEGGSVEVLAQAAFQEAYDKIYGKTKYAWDKYVKPGPGNLEGFAYKNINYINQDIGSVDVVPHEMLHNNTNASWTPFAGSELDEGATEYLTIKAVTAAKYTASHSYPDQEGVVQELVKMTSEELLMKAYFKGETDPLKKEMESKCEGSWSDFKTAMQDKNWVKAKGFLKAKKTK